MTDPITKVFDDLFTITETKTRVKATLLPPRTRVLEGIVVGLHRLKNSLNGNPRCRVFVKPMNFRSETIEYTTEPDAGWLFGISWHSLVGKGIKYYSKNKKITILEEEHFYE